MLSLCIGRSFAALPETTVYHGRGDSPSPGERPLERPRCSRRVLAIREKVRRYRRSRGLCRFLVVAYFDRGSYEKMPGGIFLNVSRMANPVRGR